MDIKFNCNKCGMCCRQIGKANLLPYFQNVDGICIHLNEDNSCNIYDNRPLVCRVDDMYKVFYADTMPLENFYAENKKICLKLRDNI